METHKKNTDEKWAALAKQLFDEPATTSSDVLNTDWDESELKSIRHTVRQIDLYFSRKRYSASEAYLRIQATIQSPKANTKKFSLSSVWFRVAVVLVLAMLLGTDSYWLTHSWQKSVPQQISGTSDYGLTRIELADGSVVTLNHGSYLHYPEKFSGKLREVSLDGEAFFEVKPDREQPFLIHAGKADIQVLGTTFNVNAYPQNTVISVVVQTGRVQVSSNEYPVERSDMILIPGEKGVLNDGALQFQKSQNDDLNYLAWKTHSFIFNKTSLKDVIQQLRKVYRVQITTADPDMEKLLLTARFDDRSVGFILEVIAMTHRLKIDQTGENDYFLKRD